MAITNNHYDVMILGDGLSGVITGALLAQKRYRVVLLRTVNVESATGEAIKLRSRPQFFWPDIFDGAFAAPVKNDLGLAHTLRTVLTGQDNTFQVVGDDLRVDVPGGLANLPGDVAREFPDLSDLKEVIQLLQGLHADLTAGLASEDSYYRTGLLDYFRHRRLKKQTTQAVENCRDRRQRLDELLDKPPYGALFTAPTRFFSLADPAGDAYAPLTFMPLAEQVLHLASGNDVTDLFVERLAKRGGQVVSEELTLNLSRSSRPFHLDVGRNGALSADVLLHNLPPCLLPLVWPGRSSDTFLARLNKNLEPAWMRYHQTYHLHPDGVPEGMGNLVILTPDHRTLSFEDTLLLVRDPLRSFSPDRIAMDVVRHVPLAGLDRQTMAALAEDTHQKVCRLCPFIERHVIERYDQRIWWPDTTGIDLPVGNSPIVYRIPEGRDAWPTALITPRVDRNVYMAAADPWAALNSNAPFAAGLNLYRYILKRHPLKELG